MCLVSGLHVILAEIAGCLAKEAYMKELKQSLQDATQGEFNYPDLRGIREMGDISQQEQVSQLMQTTGVEAYLPLYRISRMVPSRSPTPPQIRATPYRSNPPTHVPQNYGPERTPLHSPDPCRSGATVGETEPSRISNMPPIPAYAEVDPALFTAHRGRRQAAPMTWFTVRGHLVALLLDEELHECYLLKWNTQSKMQRT